MGILGKIRASGREVSRVQLLIVLLALAVVVPPVSAQDEIIDSTAEQVSPIDDTVVDPTDTGETAPTTPDELVAVLVSSLGEGISAEEQAELTELVTEALGRGVPLEAVQAAVDSVAGADPESLDAALEILKVELAVSDDGTTSLDLTLLIADLGDLGLAPEAVETVAREVEGALPTRSFGEGAYQQLVTDVTRIVFQSLSDTDEPADEARAAEMSAFIETLATVTVHGDQSMNKPKLTDIAELLAAAKANPDLDMGEVADELAAAIESNSSLQQAIKSIESRYGLSDKKGKGHSKKESQPESPEMAADGTEVVPAEAQTETQIQSSAEKKNADKEKASTRSQRTSKSKASNSGGKGKGK